MPHTIRSSKSESVDNGNIFGSISDYGYSEDAQKARDLISEVSKHYREPMSRLTAEDKFDDLAATWKYNNAIVSAVSDIVLDPAYQEIVGMGEKALPFIFEELKREPHYWFWALKAITGVDPVPEQHRGNMKAMAADWLGWAKESGYVA